jgi:GNAT superfamily N-acetyltransferase
LIHYRPFRNTDPPALAEIWRSQPPLARLAQPMSAALWEQCVLSKVYFDPEGLIVATDGARPVGFVHAGFGPNEERDCLDCRRGVVGRLFVAPHAERGVIMGELLAAAENYLTRRGACEALAGSVDHRGPFYLGLYGSSRLVGLLESDHAQIDYFLASGYEQIGERIVLQRSLMGFRPPVDRDQVRHRKSFDVVLHDDPIASNWWDACATSHLERISVELVPKGGGRPAASATAAHLPTLGMARGVRAAGFEEISAPNPAWLDGSAVLLVAEAMKGLQTRGVSVVEAVVEDLASPLGRVLATLGFAPAERGVVLRKSLGPVDPQA